MHQAKGWLGITAVPGRERCTQVCTSHLWRQVSKTSLGQRITYVGPQGTTRGLSVPWPALQVPPREQSLGWGNKRDKSERLRKLCCRMCQGVYHGNGKQGLKAMHTNICIPVCELWCFILIEYQQRYPAGMNCSKIQTLACHRSTSMGTLQMEGGDVLGLIPEAC